MDKLWHIKSYLNYEDAWNPQRLVCLISFSLTVVGDPEEKWLSFAIMLHAYLAQDKEDEEDI